MTGPGRAVIDEEDCIRALREAAKELGETPSKPQYVALGKRPAANSIQRIMGGWNAAKEAAGFDLIKPGDRGGSPILPKPEDVDIPEDQEWEEMAPPQRWYYKNRDRRMAVKDRRRQELKRWFYELKLEHYQCERCGEGAPPCLDFHHEGDKQDDVSLLVNNGYSKERILEEIASCSVLCANCHQIEHNPPRLSETSNLDEEEYGIDLSEEKRIDVTALPGRAHPARIKLREWVLKQKAASDGCEDCGEENPVCLEFHHNDKNEKDQSVARLISYTSSKDRLKIEMGKCTLLCRNCHRKVHYEVPETPD